MKRFALAATTLLALTALSTQAHSKKPKRGAAAPAEQAPAEQAPAEAHEEEMEAPAIVEYREVLFESLGKHMKALSTIAKGKVDRRDDMAGHAAAIASVAAMLPGAFPEGSGPGQGFHTEALPTVWSDWDGFVAAANRLQTEATTLAEMAGNADTPMGELGGQLGKVGQSCGGCHDGFREDDDH